MDSGGSERTRFLFASPLTGAVAGGWGRRGFWRAETMAMGSLGGDREVRTGGRRDETKELMCNLGLGAM